MAAWAAEKANAPVAAAVAASLPAEGLDPDGPPPGTTRQARERDVDAGEVRLHVRIVGSDTAGATLLVANGGPCSYEYITGLDALAGPGRRVVYYDMRGVAPSTKPASGDYRLDALVADFEAVRAAVGAPQVDALGHSWGTVVAAAYAARHPDRIRSLVLANPMALTSDAQKRSFEKLGAYEDSLVPLGLATDHPPETSGDDCTARDKARIRRYFANPRSPYAGQHGSRCYVEARKKSFEGIDGVDLTPMFARIRGPVLVLPGDGDPFGQEPFEQVVRALTAALVTRTTIARCGHLSSLEAHDNVTSKLREWLAAARSR
jgi:pimeloyl-ACP methyl ester carboxylesterase